MSYHSFYIDDELLSQRFERFLKVTNANKSKVIREAIKEFLDSKEKQLSELVKIEVETVDGTGS